ncbi:hypothetical protein CEXT_187981 [Caerostris extrusa]|uniref:Uncharacterized protein n=1 Tax=Caerostris extrusa TaxID=172846 RepID=A0AAV4MPG7_CAEEX|nr:hypothetical protein CEXT_187981 [Caerostris extrusa]
MKRTSLCRGHSCDSMIHPGGVVNQPSRRVSAYLGKGECVSVLRNSCVKGSSYPLFYGLLSCIARRD